MSSDTTENARSFVESCKKSKEAFDTWVNSCGEEELSSRFSQLAELLSLLNAIVEKAEKVLPSE